MSGSKPWSRMLPLMTAVAGILALAGCSGPDVPPDVDPQQLVGTWTIDATFDSPEQPFIDFVEGGTWTASDGCNRVQGTWELGPAGELTTTSGPSTLMACAGAQLPLAVSEAKAVATEAYASYQRMLDAGIAREVARIVLPLSIYSSMYVTMNARSLMNFLSLRTKREGTHFPSFPQREIEMVAEAMEELWKPLMPLTHAAFESGGRVAP